MTDSTMDAPQQAVPGAIKQVPQSDASLASRILPPLAVFVFFIGLWYLYAGSLSDRERRATLAYPHQVLQDFFGGGPTGDQPQELIKAFGFSAVVALLGLVIAMILGLTAAILMNQAKWVETSFYPYAIFLQTVPILALVPLIGLNIGFGLPSRVLVAIIISLFPIITNTLFGLKSAEKGLHEIFTLHDASRMTRLFKLQIPAALPAMFTGFQISAGLSVIGSIVGGFFFGRGPKGLGNRVQVYANNLRPAELIAAIILSALLGLIFFSFFGWLGKRMTRNWHQPI